MACGVDRLVRGASRGLSGPLATSNGLVTPCAVPHILESCDLPCKFCMCIQYVTERPRMWAPAHHAALYSRHDPRAGARPRARDGDEAQAAGSHLEGRLTRGDLAQRLAKLLSIHTGAHTHRRSDTVVWKDVPRQAGRGRARSSRRGTGNGTRSPSLGRGRIATRRGARGLPHDRRRESCLSVSHSH